MAHVFRDSKLKHWRASSGIIGLEGAPVLDLRFYLE